MDVLVLAVFAPPLLPPPPPQAVICVTKSAVSAAIHRLSRRDRAAPLMLVMDMMKTPVWTKRKAWGLNAPA
jgi:hypothetical protein